MSYEISEELGYAIRDFVLEEIDTKDKELRKIVVLIGKLLLEQHKLGDGVVFKLKMELREALDHLTNYTLPL